MRGSNHLWNRGFQIQIYRPVDIQLTVSTLTDTGKLPIPSAGWTSWSNTSLFIWPAAPRHIETVVLLRRKNIDDHLEFMWTDEEFGDHVRTKKVVKKWLTSKFKLRLMAKCKVLILRSNLIKRIWMMSHLWPSKPIIKEKKSSPSEHITHLTMRFRICKTSCRKMFNWNAALLAVTETSALSEMRQTKCSVQKT